MQNIHAWRKNDGQSQPGSPVKRPGAPSGQPQQTSRFFKDKRLGFRDTLGDGFRDAGGKDPSASSVSSSAHNAMLLVDRSVDNGLSEFVTRVHKRIRRANDAVTKVMVGALMVSESLGRSGTHVQGLEGKCEKLIAERMNAGVIMLGELLYEKKAAPGEKQSWQPGAGTVRYRAILFKAIADWLGFVHCALCRDDAGNTWNIVEVENETYVLDIIFEPGALYEDNSKKAKDYLSRCQQAGKNAVAPSGQQGLDGKMPRPSWHVEPWEANYDRKDRAGRGGFGEVFRGQWAGMPVAIKEVRDTNPTDDEVCDFILEISLLSGLSHPNIVRFFRGCVDLRGGTRTLLLITEWMDRGVLSGLIHEAQEPVLTMGQNLVVALGVARGMAYLHDVGILHLDLKSPNVLLSSHWATKLCDFGLAKMKEQTSLNTTMKGVSPIWAPPEMFDDQNGGITEKADVYSFGIILFELVVRKLPFSDISQMQLPRVKAKGQLPKIPGDVDADIKSAMETFMSHRPQGRPPMAGVITRIQQLAKARQIDLVQEQSQMETQGFHGAGGSGGDGHKSEELRRAEAEKKKSEDELARLKKLLQEEQSKLQLIEEKVREKGFGSGEDQAKAKEFCEQHCEKLSDDKFRCSLCRKLFRGPEFVHKHIREKHLDEMLKQTTPKATPSGSANHAPVGRKNSDRYADADVGDEDDGARMYTNKMGGAGGGKGAGSGQFSQALQDAAEQGDLSRVQQCLRQGGVNLNQVDSDHSSPLHLSSKNGHVEVVQYMISNSADVKEMNDSGFLALHLAAQEGHTAICEMILGGAAPVDAHGNAKARTPLHLAAANGHRDTCGVLLFSKANVNLQDNDGVSALHNAARFGNKDLCEVILSWGASVNVTDHDGWAPVHEAARWGDGELVESLLQRGADVNARSNDGESALHAVPGGYAEIEVIEVLLQWKCEVNCKDYDGETPLHVAVKLGDEDMTGILLENGADANSKNHSGQTPLDVAKKDDIRWLLRQHKAKKG